MKPAGRRIVAALAVGFTAGLAALALRDPGPSIDGQSLGRWLVDSRRQSPDLRRPLAAIGPEAIPRLAALRDWDRPVWNAWLEGIAGRAPDPVSGWMAGLIRRPGPDVRSDVLYGLRLFGPEARGELDWIRARASDPTADLAPGALAAVLDIAPEDPASTALARRWLSDTNPAVRRRAARVVQSTRARIPEAVGELSALLHEDVVSVEMALLALARIGPGAASAAPDVAARLTDPVHGRSAARALAAMGTDAVTGVLPAVYRAMLTVRPPPFEALAGAGTNAAPALDVVELHLQDPDPLVRIRAAWAAAWLRGDPAGAVPVLSAAISGPDGASRESFLPPAEPFDSDGGLAPLGVRGTAAWLLGELGPAGHPARAALQEAAHGGEPVLALLAVRALRRQGAPFGEFIDVCRTGLESNDPLARRLAAILAGEAGADAAVLEPELRRAMATDLFTRRFAREALGAVGN